MCVGPALFGLVYVTYPVTNTGGQRPTRAAQQSASRSMANVGRQAVRVNRGATAYTEYIPVQTQCAYSKKEWDDETFRLNYDVYDVRVDG